MIVAASRKACILYKYALDKYLTTRCRGRPYQVAEVVMTFQAHEKEDIIEDYKRKLMDRYHVTDPKEAVQKIVEAYKNEECLKILIVTDMLLTGLDAPHTTDNVLRQAPQGP